MIVEFESLLSPSFPKLIKKRTLFLFFLGGGIDLVLAVDLDKEPVEDTTVVYLIYIADKSDSSKFLLIKRNICLQQFPDPAKLTKCIEFEDL